MTAWLCRASAGLLVLASLIPPVYLAITAWHNAVNVPFWDQWDASYWIASRAANGTLTFSDLFVQLNEHLWRPATWRPYSRSG